MNRTSLIKLKALFVLVVFLSNTVITFACSVGLKMTYSVPHHESEPKGNAHGHGESQQKAEAIFQLKAPRHHADGSPVPHEHDEKPAGVLTADNEGLQSPDKAVDDHHKSGNPDDNCCKDEAVKFGKADKIAQKSANLKMAPAHFPLFIPANTTGSTRKLEECFGHRKYLVRGHHPPIASIRIAIQSFQI